ncbi:Senescence regulator S40 [Spatholobus suberectus]|nr:Senescence regulator S40 [Spatholobus suberectus]
MASRKSFLSKVSSIFAPSTDLEPKSTEGDLELDEADVWNLSNNNNTVTEAKKGSRSAKKKGKKVEGGGRVNPVASSSLPVNIPDWSKILKEDYKDHKKRVTDEDVVSDDDNDGGDRVPPHEYLARTRGASLSVHEGRGRTLKGRDLRSVRNAIWKKMGFED